MKTFIVYDLDTDYRSQWAKRLKQSGPVVETAEETNIRAET